MYNCFGVHIDSLYVISFLVGLVAFIFPKHSSVRVEGIRLGCTIESLIFFVLLISPEKRRSWLLLLSRLSPILICLEERIHKVGKLIEESSIAILLLLRLLKSKHVLVMHKSIVLLVEWVRLVAHAEAKAERPYTEKHEK